MIKKHSVLQALTLAISLPLAGHASAGVDPCSLLKAEEVGHILAGNMRSNPVGEACYFMGPQKEVVVFMLGGGEFEKQKRFALGPLGQKLGWKIESVPGVGSETVEWNDRDRRMFLMFFQKGATGVRLETKGVADLKAAAEALSKLVAQRLP